MTGTRNMEKDDERRTPPREGPRRRPAFGDWIRAVRPWSFTASALPALTAFGFLAGRHAAFDVTNAALSLAVLILMHAGANLLSDCRDAETGVDGDGASNGVTWIVRGLFSVRRLRRLAALLFAVATVLGLTVALRSTIWLLAFGTAGAALAVGYSSLKRRALGDVAVLATFVLLPAGGLGLACCGAFDGWCAAVLLPGGFLTLAILHANNVRDRDADAASGCLTLATRISARAARALYGFELLAPYLTVVLLLALGVLPYAALGVFLTVPQAHRAYRSFRAGELSTLDRTTARLQTAFAALLALSLPVADLNFWCQLALGSLLLGAFSWRGHPPFPARAGDVLREGFLGLSLAAVLWGLFWLGDAFSRALLPFARDQVEAIYRLKEGCSPLALAGLLLLLVGPAEELFWRGTLQRRLSERLGANAGCALATAAYALIHVFSGNFMLVSAAGVCGAFWGLAYRFFPKHFPAILISHAVWDVAVFLVFPI